MAMASGKDKQSWKYKSISHCRVYDFKPCFVLDTHPGVSMCENESEKVD